MKTGRGEVGGLGAVTRLALALTVVLTSLLSLPLAYGEEPKVLRFAPVVVHDPQVNNLEALRFLAPAGWKVEGGVVWRHDTWLLASLSMRLSDPQSRASITILPAETFTWSPTVAQYSATMPGGRYMGSVIKQMPAKLADSMTGVLIPVLRPQLVGAKITATESLPQVASTILKQNKEAGFEQTCEAVRMRFEYNEADGTPMQEDVYAVMITTPMPAINSMSWYLERAYSVRAEKGKFDALTPVLGTMITSAHVGEDWLAGYGYVVQLRNKGTMQAIADAGALSKHLAQNAEDMRKMNRESYENAQRVQDNASRAFSQATRGVEDYAVPGGGGGGSGGARVELPSGYSHVWYDKAAGEYVLSNDPKFDPNSISNHSWTPVEKAGK